MNCDVCGRYVRRKYVVYDVAVMMTTAGEVEDEHNEWDPTREGYICNTCWESIPEKVRGALT